MKGAQAKIVGALFLKMDIGSHHVNDIVGAQDFLHFFIRIIHIYSFSFYCFRLHDAPCPGDKQRLECHDRIPV